jgi:hypothetical protein
VHEEQGLIMSNPSVRKSLRGRVRQIADAALRPLGWRLVRRTADTPQPAAPELSAEARSYLRADNPRLLALREAYASLDWPVVTRGYYWTDGYLAGTLDLTRFRADNAYLWQEQQLGVAARLKRYIMLREIERHLPDGLLQRLGEDGLFGCWVEQYGPDRPPISRDLLDSANEIAFLEQHVGLSGQPGLRVLDIGAGYGRLAHRMCQALPNLAYYDCVDAVAESTFLCEYYLRIRGVAPPARAIPLHEIDSALAPGGYHLAVNIHSFTECSYAAIAWWLARVASLNIPWLLIVPNHPDQLMSTEADHSHRDYAPLLAQAGYRLQVKQLVCRDPEVADVIGVHDHFLLYRRDS